MGDQPKRLGFVACAALCVGLSRSAAAQQGDAPTGAPPADAAALVAAPTASGKEPDLSKPPERTTVSLSAGGQLATGNSRLLAGTANGTLDSRFGANGFGASLLGNYGQGAPPGNAVVETAENVQGRLRYDRYFVERASVFLIVTGRHDRFQGLDFRLNLDPGVKYVFVKAAEGSLWGEAGYDFQFDLRRDDALAVLDASGTPVLDANGNAEMLPKTATDSSTRLYVGFRHAFNKEVTLATGVEYLQSVEDSNRYRVNVDALFAAQIGAGFALGLGFSARYDNAPLPGKEQMDTATTASLIYSFSDLPPSAPSHPGAPKD